MKQKLNRFFLVATIGMVISSTIFAESKNEDLNCLWVFNSETNSFKCVSVDDGVVYNDKLDESVGAPKEHKDCDEKGMRRSLTNDSEGLSRPGCVI